jgi:hypothetical protein
MIASFSHDVLNHWRSSKWLANAFDVIEQTYLTAPEHDALHRPCVSSKYGSALWATTEYDSAFHFVIARMPIAMAISSVAPTIVGAGTGPMVRGHRRGPAHRCRPHAELHRAPQSVATSS